MTTSSKIKLAIIGAGELGKLVAHHALKSSQFKVVGFYDNFPKKDNFENLPVFGKIEKIIDDYNSGLFDKLFIAIGYNQMKSRSQLFLKFKGIISFANIIHSSSFVDDSCKLGEGIFILPGCTLDFGVELEDNILLNTGVTIAHHTKIKSHTFVSPGATMAGLITINECCFIGINSTIIDGINVGTGSIIGGGAVVIKDTEKNSVSVGVPSKTIKFHNNL